MKKLVAVILVGTLCFKAARAQTTLLVGPASSENCWSEVITSFVAPPVLTIGFTLPDVEGTGYVISSVLPTVYNDPTTGNQTFYWVYGYGLDLSQMALTNNEFGTNTFHCISLEIPFGADVFCANDVLETLTPGDIPVTNATQDVSGTDTFLFAQDSQCLEIGLTSDPFQLVSPPGIPPHTNLVQVIDNTSDPNTGLPVVNKALVWAYVPNTPHPFFPPPGLDPLCTNCPTPAPPEFTVQGVVQSNCVTCLNPQPLPPGRYEVRLAVMTGQSNSFPMSPTISTTTQVGNGGEFTVCAPQQLAFLSETMPWLSVSMRPGGSTNSFTQFTLPVKPAPQAYFAYTAGIASGLNQGAAVTSLNGLTDGVLLQSDDSMSIYTSNQVVYFSAGILSDKNSKTDVKTINPDDILAKLSSLPIQSWRYTNEVAGLRHVGPMAQDFKAAFNLGDSGRMISIVDEGGVALAAIQALNQKLESLNQELKRRDAENVALQKQFADKNAEIEQLRQSLNELQRQLPRSSSK